MQGNGNTTGKSHMENYELVEIPDIGEDCTDPTIVSAFKEKMVPFLKKIGKGEYTGFPGLLIK